MSSMDLRKKRRLILWGCAAGIGLSLFVFWICPRSMETLVETPPENITFWGLESDSGETDGEAISSFTDHGGASAVDDLKYLYSLTFSRPVLCTALSYDTGCASYSLAFMWGDHQLKRFYLLEDGVLWDGTWCYSLAGGETALAGLKEWLAAFD